MAFFQKHGDDTSLPRGDRGLGSFDDYAFDLIPRTKKITMTLANSDPYQDELRMILDSGEPVETAISARSMEQERIDAPYEVRLFTGRRVSGVVGTVPRGLESVIDETLRRLDDRGEKVRIPVRVVGKPGALRVQLLMGTLR